MVIMAMTLDLDAHLHAERRMCNCVTACNACHATMQTTTALTLAFFRYDAPYEHECSGIAFACLKQLRALDFISAAKRLVCGSCVATLLPISTNGMREGHADWPWQRKLLSFRA